MDRSKTHYDLRDAFAGDGCPICALTEAAVDRYFATLNYEAAGDRGVRAHLRLTLGFCRPHAHQWLAAGGNEGDLQRIAGWSSPQMLQRYGRSAADQRAREAYRRNPLWGDL